jgi:hypothetical protein
MPSYSPTAKILANVHRFGRFYLASVLTGVLGLLLLLSAHLENNAALQYQDYTSIRPARPPHARVPQIRLRRGR